jgi:PKD repeat protein
MYPTSTGAGNQLWQSKTNKFLSEGWGLYHGSASATSNDWRFFMGNSAVASTDAFTIPLNTWTHVAIQRYTNGTVFIYLNGNYTTSKAMVGSYDTSNPYRIGRQGTGANSNSFIGYTDEARGSDVVRWYANFTPPTEAYRNGQLNPDTNPYSTLRFKTDPVNTARITNQTDGGVRNRTIQIQNVNAVSHIVGSMTFDQEHLLVKNIHLNKTVWPDTTLVSSFINNEIGYVEFNVTRAGGFSPDTTRSSFLDTEMLYWNYTPTGVSSSSFFGYGVVINQTTGTSYPIHNFIETVLTYTDWDFYPNFTADVTTGNAPLTVQFTDTTVGYPNQWDWDFGDGVHVNWTTQNPTHIYANPGLYTVTLNGTIWQNTSVMNQTVKVAYINVTDGTPPKGITGLSATAINCTNMTFRWTNPTDADYYRLQYRVNNSANSTLSNATTSKLLEGLPESTSIEFSTQTEDLVGNINSTWVNATASTGSCGVAPVAAFSANTTSVCIGTEFRDYVQFTDTSSNTPTSWFWLFGNAGVDSHLQNPVTNTFDTVGFWDVKLQATNAYGMDWENKTNMIEVTDCTPEAAFTYLPHEGIEVLSVQFTDTSSHTPTGWGWFFQNKTGNDTIVQFSTLQNPLKGFGVGNYTIKLNATNLYGSNVTPANPYVNVSPYVAPLIPPVAAFSANATSICQNATVAFTDLSTSTPVSWLWQFGDGNTSILQNPSNTYYSLGSFTVNLKATNADGFDWENKTGYITVNDCTPIPPVLQCVDASGNIPVALSGSTYNSLNWTWVADDIIKLSLDGVFLNADIDNSSPSLTTYGLTGNTWHALKVYNITDFGRLNCKTNASGMGGQVSVYPVSQTPVSPYLAAVGLIITGIVRLYIRRKEEP